MRLLVLKVFISYLVASLCIIIMVLAPLFYVATGSIFPPDLVSSGPVAADPVCPTCSMKPPLQLFLANDLEPNTASGVAPDFLLGDAE